MPCPCATRRRFLTGSLAAATLPLAGCDEVSLPNLVSPEQVEAMGLQAWQQINKTVPVSRNPSGRAAVDRVARRCLQGAGEPPAEWEVTLFASEQVNAFALPGRKIGIYEGMFRAARAEAELAAVIGHEIGHVQANHAKERMNAEVARNLGLRLVAIVLQVGDVQYAEGIAAALGVGLQYGLVLPYSRQQELEADRLGLTTMAQAGFDPAAAVTLWQRMDRIAGDGPPAFLSTHPAPQARIRRIEEMIAGR